MSAASAPASARDTVEAHHAAAEGRRRPKSPVHRQRRAAQASRDVHWVKPELVAEIEFAGWTGDGMVRQAAFKGLREDKPAARGRGGERPAPAERRRQLDAKPRAEGADPRRAARRQRRGERRRHGRDDLQPDKALWPDAGDGEPVTKLDLARYLEAVGAWMMRAYQGPALLDHPHAGRHRRRAVLPAPRHAGHVRACSSWSRSPATASPTCRSTASRAWSPWPRSAALELHPWNCQPGPAGGPGPPGVRPRSRRRTSPSTTVIDGGAEIASGWRRWAWSAFCKTTGGKGLHVVTPLEAREERARLADGQGVRPGGLPAMAADSAGPLSDQHGQEAARRAGSSSTICATTACRRRWRRCRRARGRAPPVSMPLTWSQVKTGLDPKRLHAPHRAGPAEEDQGLGGLRRGRAPAEGRDRKARPMTDFSRPDFFGPSQNR